MPESFIIEWQAVRFLLKGQIDCLMSKSGQTFKLSEDTIKDLLASIGRAAHEPDRLLAQYDLSAPQTSTAALKARSAPPT